MRKGILVSLVLVISLTFPVSPANAAWIQYQDSPADTYNRPEVIPEYDITQIGFGVNDSDPDEYWFYLEFAKPVTANRFNDDQGSWAIVLLDINNDGENDYSLETTDTPYIGNLYKAGKFIDRSNPDAPIISTKCYVNTWTNLDKQANWIGFSIKKNCLSLKSTIGVQGFASYKAGGLSYDYGPDSIWKLNINEGSVSPKGSSSSTTIVGHLPIVNSAGEFLVDSPANSPSDLVSLAAQTTKSVVTVQCGNGVGSGWSINATLSTANISNGYNSYVITNHHVIEDCIGSRSVTLLLSDQTKVSGYVYTWDEANDVAGILTSKVIAPLNWRGATPQQGWWVGVLGSPLGFPGILTTGIVSSVNSSTFLGTTNAAINPGNSGGPVFDRSGRVIGLATAKYSGSEGFGIFNGTPLLCNKIVLCTGTSQIWLSGAAAADAAAAKAIADAAAAKAAAELKAKQEAEAKAAAELKAKQEAEAKAAAEKLIADAKAEAERILAAEKLIADAKAAADKAAAEKLIADAKAEAERILAKAAAEKLIADAKAEAERILAAAKAAATAKTTITCIKGKLIKKVTAVKPKCPAGYKVKK